MEAASLLGSALTISDVCKDLPILKPKSIQFQPVPTHQAKVSKTLFRNV